jgi:carboxylesterase
MSISNVFLHGKGKTAVILFHGFTGSPEELMELGETINKEEYNVFIPLLPGHGTNWRELNRIKSRDYISFSENVFEAIQDEYEEVSLVGFSFGGTVALYLSEKYEIKRLILINSMILVDLSLILGKFVSPVLPVFPSFPDVHKKIENPPFSYGIYPLKAVSSIVDFIKLTRENIKKVTADTMVIYSVYDHTVSVKNSLFIYNEVSSREKRIIPLTNSYHMAVLDYDKEEMFKKIVDFLQF